MSNSVMWKFSKKSVLFLVAMVLLFTITGCSLADKDAGEEVEVENKDRLVGVFITRDSINSWTLDMTNSEENRYYATIDAHDSSNLEDWTIDFEGLEGYVFFNAEFPGEDGPYYAQPGKQVCSDVHLALHTADNAEENSLSGTMYVVSKHGGEEIFYANAVYQTHSGEIYCVASQGVQTSPYGEVTVGLEEERTATENGETKVYKSEVNVTFEVLESLPATIRFQFMNDKLEVIGSASYAPGEVPEELNVLEGTSCVIVETVWEDGSITRELCEKEPEDQCGVETFYRLDGLLLAKKTTICIWE